MAGAEWSDAGLRRFAPPVRVSILMLADGALHYSPGADFGLGELVRILEVRPGETEPALGGSGARTYAEFRVVKAHRSTHILNRSLGVRETFVLTDAALAEFDELWLFGFEQMPLLPDPQIAAVWRFMDAGGGVFATGDHEALGLSLCGAIPRVRSMRRWWYHQDRFGHPIPVPSPGDRDSPVSAVGDTSTVLAPPVSGRDRFDTLRAGVTTPRATRFEVDDQSDDVPQPIQPRTFPTSGGAPVPHPLLCTRSGALLVFPDHAHEGECVVPALHAREAHLEFEGGPDADSYDADEYPVSPLSGRRVAPEIIATSTVLEGNDAKSPPARGRRFGAIGAYDGHRAGVGRVVVDATWHHFLNINLTGLDGVTEGPRSQGFLSSTEGERHYADIVDYFRNIAVWTARAGQQHEMLRRAFFNARWLYPIDEEVAVAGGPQQLFRAGVSTRDALRRLTTRCQRLDWVVGMLRELRPDLIGLIDHYLDPWTVTKNEKDSVEPLAGVDGEILHLVLLGSMMVRLVQAFPIDPTQKEEDLIAMIQDSLHGAEKAAFVAAAEIFDEGARAMSNAVAALRQQ